MPRRSKVTSPPEELTGDALLFWSQYLTDFKKLGKFQQSDRAGLVALCQASALRVDAARNLEKTGSIIALPNGYPGPSPYLKVLMESLKIEKGLLQEFRATPAARARVKPEPVPV